ncbi:MAG: porin family protein [Nitrospirae bacterium]|nr:porin family protein [Nitrospirota bacterium]MCL5977599.1 porin family protein [Nitrospirota bacterium]
MKKFLAIMCILTAVLFYCSGAEAVEAGISEGTSELGTMAAISSLSGKAQGSKFTSTTTLGLAQYGYFITDHIQLGGSVLYMGQTSKTADEKSTSDATGIDLYGKYHFYSKGQSVVPYLGVQAGYLDISAKSDGDSASGDAFSYGGMGGLKFFITEKISFNTELNYRRYKMDITSGGTKVGVNVNNLTLLLGLFREIGGWPDSRQAVI